MEQMKLDECTGSELLGHVCAEGVLLLSFRCGFVVVEAVRAANADPEDYPLLELNADLDWLLFSRDELARIGVGTREEIGARIEETRALKNRNCRIRALEQVTALAHSLTRDELLAIIAEVHP